MLEAAKSAYPLSSQAILDAEGNVEAFEDGLESLERYYKELFGTPEENNPAAKAPAKKSKAKTEQGKARAEAAGLAVE